MGDLVQQYRGYIIMALAFSIIFGGYVLAQRVHRPEPIEIIAPTATVGVQESSICVHVAGGVPYPGLYELASGSRWVDAIEAAGGMRVDAMPDGVNLAQKLADGQQVYVPMEGIPIPPSPTVPQRTSVLDMTGLININTAQSDELETLPGIGPVYAERIIAHRESNGAFETIADIMAVKGIGPKCFERIESRICVQ